MTYTCRHCGATCEAIVEAAEHEPDCPLRVSPNIQAWCEERSHPWVTYNPRLDMTFCRCGVMREHGEKPMDWQAKHEAFHTCPAAGPCHCYLTS